jgi:hypothetical protein
MRGNKEQNFTPVLIKPTYMENWKGLLFNLHLSGAKDFNNTVVKFQLYIIDKLNTNTSILKL